MNQYKINTQEITTLITLYSKISTVEKRMFAQGYLKGLAEEFSILETDQSSKENMPNMAI